MITINLENYTSVQQQLAMLQLTPAKTRRLLINVSRQVVSDNKKRVREQALADGGIFQARSPKTTGKKRNKKMLVKLGQRLQFRNVTDAEVLIGWQNNLTGYIAGTQQTGQRKTANRTSLQNSATNRNLSEPATQTQAKALLAAGYKIPRGNNRGYKTPTLTWIKSNLTVGRAGAILIALRGAGKQQWDIVLPARPAFGIADADIQKYIDIALNTLSPSNP